jgi:hypothetical protein
LSTPILLQSTVGSITVFLELNTGVAATGLLFSSITASLKKEGESSFSAFTLTGSNFTEISNGFYEIDFTTSNTNTLGNLYLSITGPTVKTSLFSVYIAVAGSVSPTVAPPVLETSTISGYLQNLEGSPISGSSVSAKILNIPALTPGSGGNLVGISTTTIVTKTDTQGYFSLTLLVGTSVDIIIPSINYRRTILVPEADASLFLIP